MKTRNVSILLNNEYHRLIIHHFLYKQVVRQKAFLMSALQMSPTWGGLVFSGSSLLALSPPPLSLLFFLLQMSHTSIILDGHPNAFNPTSIAQQQVDPTRKRTSRKANKHVDCLHDHVRPNASFPVMGKHGAELH